MKTLIIGFIGLFGLALLASDAAAEPPSFPPKGKLPPETTVPGLPAVCNDQDGIIIIILQNSGNVAGFACPNRNNNPSKPITYEGETLPVKTPPLETPPHVDGEIGMIKKYQQTGDPDPCINWVDGGGNSRFYCW